jgi:thiamine-monophosphate kinase
LRAALPKPSAASGLLLGPGDDAALWQPQPGFQTVLTTDLLAEGVHFDLAHFQPWELGARTAAANLSDLAAMGAHPRAFLVSVALPPRRGLGAAWLDAFHNGLHAWSRAFGAEPAGGDLSASKSGLFINACYVGEVETGRALRREGARPGDWVLCTGTLGDSAAGLHLLKNARAGKGLDAGLRLILEKRHKTPVPRVLAGRWLLQHKAASSCIDISDGLASEAAHLAEEGGVRLDLDAAYLPQSQACLSAAAVLKKDPQAWALHGGEDYELLFTAPEKIARQLIVDLPEHCGCEVSVLGQVRRGRGAWMRQGRRTLPLKGGYEHALG